jgi:hypothetical protein
MAVQEVHPALEGQSGQLACDQCGTLFYQRCGSGGSKQRFCSDGCRKISNRERQRSQRRGSYAGPTALSASELPTPKTLTPERAVTALSPWETAVLDITDCERTEFLVALSKNEVASIAMETWPPEVRAVMDQHVSRWVKENGQTHTVRAMTVAAPKHHGLQSCVVILHHSRK